MATDKETITRLIVALVISILDILKLFGIDFGIDEDTVYNLVLAVVTIVFGGLCFWKNNNFTIEACESTGEMRQRKREQKKDYKGEKFYEL